SCGPRSDQQGAAGRPRGRGKQFRPGGRPGGGDGVRRRPGGRRRGAAAPLRPEGATMSTVDVNGFARNDASVLAERLQVDQAQARARAKDPHAELKTRIHRTCIAKLGAAFLNLEGSDELERRVQEVVSEELAGEEVPLSPSERKLLERQIGDDILGYG